MLKKIFEIVCYSILLSLAGRTLYAPPSSDTPNPVVLKPEVELTIDTLVTLRDQKIPLPPTSLWHRTQTLSSEASRDEPNEAKLMKDLKALEKDWTTGDLDKLPRESNDMNLLVQRVNDLVNLETTMLTLYYRSKFNRLGVNGNTSRLPYQSKVDVALLQREENQKLIAILEKKLSFLRLTQKILDGRRTMDCAEMVREIRPDPKKPLVPTP